MTFVIDIIANLATATYQAGWPAVVSGMVVGAVGGWIGKVYLVAQMAVKREMSVAKGEVVGCIGGILDGLGESPQLTSKNKCRD